MRWSRTNSPTHTRENLGSVSADNNCVYVRTQPHRPHDNATTDRSRAAAAACGGLLCRAQKHSKMFLINSLLILIWERERDENVLILFYTELHCCSAALRFLQQLEVIVLIFEAMAGTWAALRWVEYGKERSWRAAVRWGCDGDFLCGLMGGFSCSCWLLWFIVCGETDVSMWWELVALNDTQRERARVNKSINFSIFTLSSTIIQLARLKVWITRH